MTTITIERAFLIKVLDQLDIAQSLLERSQHHAKIEAMYKELRAALAAPATAPATAPAWYDAPTVPGLWACRQFITDRVQAYEVIDEMAFNKNLGLKGRWYGPIPPDGDKP